MLRDWCRQLWDTGALGHVPLDFQHQNIFSSLYRSSGITTFITTKSIWFHINERHSMMLRKLWCPKPCWVSSRRSPRYSLLILHPSTLLANVTKARNITRIFTKVHQCLCYSFSVNAQTHKHICKHRHTDNWCLQVFLQPPYRKNLERISSRHWFLQYWVIQAPTWWF